MTRPIDHVKKPASWKWTTSEAWDRFACAKCGRPIHPSIMGDDHLGSWSDLDRAEYWISGLCPQCFEAVMADFPE